jgi:hypothetical protein
MIMDSLGSLALATEPPYDKLLFRKPYGRDEYIISYQMWKHIIPQACVQFMLMMILYLNAPNFVVEDELSRITQSNYLMNCYGKIPGSGFVNGQYYIISGLSFDWDTSLKRFTNASNVTCPTYLNSDTLYDAESTYNSQNGATAHMTIVFNTFVMYTLLNQVNSRVLTDDLNIFDRIFENILFIAIVILEAGAQAIIVQFGSVAFQCSNNGLTARQWGICIGFAMLTFPVCFFMKFIPMEKCLERMMNAWSERRFCKSKVEVENADESKRLAEEEAPINTNGIVRGNELALNNNFNANSGVPIAINNANHGIANIDIGVHGSKNPSFQKGSESVKREGGKKMTDLRRSSKSIANQLSMKHQMREKKS